MTDWTGTRAKANEVLTKYGFEKPPVDIFEIANSEGITLRYFTPAPDTPSIEAVSGLMNKKDGAMEIFLNVLESPQRQAFTLAHELGHHYLDHNPNEVGVYRRDSLYADPKPDIEQEADLFAAELLMPRELLNKYMKDNNLTQQDVGRLAGAFGVSTSAMGFRLKNM
jgi:Zn-dependent peptidase ImmA (M78 family)